MSDPSSNDPLGETHEEHTKHGCEDGETDASKPHAERVDRHRRVVVETDQPFCKVVCSLEDLLLGVAVGFPDLIDVGLNTVALLVLVADLFNTT